MAGTRREFIGAGVGAAAAAALGAAFWDDVFGSAGSVASSPRGGYGPRGPANEHGLRLPEGFRSRLIARGGQPVEGTGYRWHEASDGMACFPADDGGWILVSNSEVLTGGASAIRFGADAQPRAAYRILDGTTQNCSGGGTPWGTWMSCEEVMGGLVWECDPAGERRALSRPAMGTFKHEAAAVDPNGRTIYLTEDLVDGRLYRFTPARWRDLSEGLLEVATVAGDGAVSWSELPDPAARRVPTRQQVRGSTAFERAEGIWHDDGVIYVATTADHRVHAYHVAESRIEVIYDGLASRAAPLLRVDQLTANRAGEVFVCEDIATEEIDIGVIDRHGRVSRFLSATGPIHAGSELTGVSFDPSGTRMYFSSQRAFGRGESPGPGAIYEVSGPFRGSPAFHATAHNAQQPSICRDLASGAMTRLLPGLAAFTAAMLVALLGLYAQAGTPESRSEPSSPTPRLVKLRLLGVNDLHGHLEPPRPGIGGAAWLKSHLDRATLPGHTIRVHAGDMVGATPLISSWFHDEPTIEAANEIGFDVGTVGNHEFDEGGEELMRLLEGGPRSGSEALKPDVTGQPVNTSSPDFAGAAFPYIAANTVDGDGGLLLPPYEIVERAGVRVGFIGVTTRSTPTFLLARHAAPFRFTDISEAVNRWVPELRRRGAEAIVVLAHAGGPGQDESDAPDYVGEIIEETRQMSSAVDVVVAGHSHSRIDVRLPNSDGSGDKLVVEALSYGVAYDLVDIVVDTRTGEVVRKSAEIPATGHEGVEADPGVAALVERYRERVAPLADHVVGTTEAPLTRSGGELGQLVATAERAFAETDVAVVKPVSLRADIDAGPVTYAEIAEALAFDHPVVRLRMNGRQLRELIGDGAYVAGPDELEPGASYSVAASELIVGAGDPVGSEPQALAWFLAR